MRVKIIYEDNDILVVHKPAGIATQSASVSQTDVVSELKNYLKGRYLGLIHRLDQPVEGLLVFGKNKKAAGVLSEELTDGRLKKSYLATVCVPKEKNVSFCERYGKGVTLTDYLKKEGGMAGVADASDPGAKKAVLFAKVTEAFVTCEPLSGCEGGRDATASDSEERGAIPVNLRVRIETGRFHQIRCQLAHDGFPILGDRKYGNETSLLLSDTLGITSLRLVADTIAFVHPMTGKELSFTLNAQ